MERRLRAFLLRYRVLLRRQLLAELFVRRPGFDLAGSSVGGSSSGRGFRGLLRARLVRHRARQPPVLLVPLLVVILGNPKRLGRSDLGGDRIDETLLLLLQRSLGGLQLIVAVGIDGRPVLGAMIRTLCIAAGGVVRGPEELQELGISDLRRIELDQHRLSMAGLAAADVFIAGVFGVAAGVTHRRCHHARNLAEALFDAPETALGERRHLVVAARSQGGAMTHMPGILAAIRIADHSILLRTGASKERHQEPYREARQRRFHDHDGHTIARSGKLRLQALPGHLPRWKSPLGQARHYQAAFKMPTSSASECSALTSGRAASRICSSVSFHCARCRGASKAAISSAIPSAASRVSSASAMRAQAALCFGARTRSTCGNSRQEVTPCGMPYLEPICLPSLWLRPAAAFDGKRYENQAPNCPAVR